MIQRSFIILMSLLLFYAPFASAQDEGVTNAEAVPAKTYQELEQEVIRLQEADRVRDEVLRNLIRRIEQLERAGESAMPGEQLPTTVTDTVEQKELTPELKERIKRESEENYQLIQKAFEQRLGREGSMLLPPYRLTYEPSITYSHASYDSIVVDGFTVYPVLVVGDIVAERVRRDVVINNHSFRLGLPHDMQANLVVPLAYEKKRSFRDDGTHTENETKGLGDISLALSYQLVKRSDIWPQTVVALEWKSDSGRDPYRQATADVPSTGSGFDTWGLSMTSMTAADPVVLYGSLSASYTPSSNKKIGRVRPGESYGANLGMALSLNLDTSLSFNFSYQYTCETEVDEQKIRGSDLTTSNLSIGLSKAESDFYAMDVDLTIGLTRDAADFQFTVSMPFDFSLAGNR